MPSAHLCPAIRPDCGAYVCWITATAAPCTARPLVTIALIRVVAWVATGGYGRGYDAKRPDPGSCDAGVRALSPGGYPSHVMVRTDRRRRGRFTQ